MGRLTGLSWACCASLKSGRSHSQARFAGGRDASRFSFPSSPAQGCVLPFAAHFKKPIGRARNHLAALPPATGVRLWRPNWRRTIPNPRANSCSRLGSLDDFREWCAETRQQFDSQGKRNETISHAWAL